MPYSKKDVLAWVLALALGNALVTLAVVLGCGRAPAPRPIQLSVAPPADLVLTTGHDAVYSGFMEVWDDHSRPERIQWRWGVKREK